MTLTELTPYLALVIAVFTLAGLIKNSLTSGEKAIATEQAEHEKKLIDLDRRVQSIESDMKHLPDRDATHRLELNLERLSSQVAQMNERIKPIAATSDRMMELLMEQGK